MKCIISDPLRIIAHSYPWSPVPLGPMSTGLSKMSPQGHSDFPVQITKRFG